MSFFRKQQQQPLSKTEALIWLESAYSLLSPEERRRSVSDIGTLTIKLEELRQQRLKLMKKCLFRIFLSVLLASIYVVMAVFTDWETRTAIGLISVLTILWLLVSFSVFDVIGSIKEVNRPIKTFKNALRVAIVMEKRVQAREAAKQL